MSRAVLWELHDATRALLDDGPAPRLETHRRLLGAMAAAGDLLAQVPATHPAPTAGSEDPDFCPNCMGSGEVRGNECRDCKGSGEPWCEGCREPGGPDSDVCWREDHDKHLCRDCLLEAIASIGGPPPATIPAAGEQNAVSWLCATCGQYFEAVAGVHRTPCPACGSDEVNHTAPWPDAAPGPSEQPAGTGCLSCGGTGKLIVLVSSDPARVGQTVACDCAPPSTPRAEYAEALATSIPLADLRGALGLDDGITDPESILEACRRATTCEFCRGRERARQAECDTCFEEEVAARAGAALSAARAEVAKLAEQAAAVERLRGMERAEVARYRRDRAEAEKERDEFGAQLEPLRAEVARVTGERDGQIAAMENELAKALGCSGGDWTGSWDALIDTAAEMAAAHIHDPADRAALPPPDPIELRAQVELLDQEVARLRAQRHHDNTWLTWRDHRVQLLERCRARLLTLLEPPAQVTP